MGERGAPTRLGSADLDRDHRFAVRARQFGGHGEAGGVPDLFQVSDDDGSSGIGGEMCDEIGCRQVAFIAGGDDMTEGQTQRAAAVEDRKAEAAALRDHGDATGRVRQCPFRLQGLRCGAKSRGDTADDVVKTLAIRPANADAGPARDLREPGLEFCPVAALFGKSGRDDDRRSNAGRGALLDDVADHVGW